MPNAHIGLTEAATTVDDILAESEKQKKPNTRPHISLSLSHIMIIHVATFFALLLHLGHDR